VSDLPATKFESQVGNPMVLFWKILRHIKRMCRMWVLAAIAQL